MILIFGATGFVGRHLCLHLKNRGKDILALGKSEKIGKFFKKNEIDFLHFDITNDLMYDKLPKKGVSCVINLAGVTDKYEVPVERYFEINTIGTYKTLEYCKKNKIKNYILSSIHKVYNDLNKDIISETDHIQYKGPYTPFILSKLAAENFVEYYNRDFGINGMIFRFTGVHGYGEMFGHLHKDNSYSASTFEINIAKAKRGETIEVWGDVAIKRDHIYVKDLIVALEKATQTKESAGLYIIASGHGISLLEEAEAIADAFASNKRSKVIHLPEKQGLNRGYVYDISKAKKAFDWEPKFSLVEMLKDYKIDEIKFKEEWE
jgi:UDP-glucose 4-epimerase